MARTKKTTINNVEYTFQSVTFSWYSNLTDLQVCGCSHQGLRYGPC